MFELRSKTKWYCPPGKWFYGPPPSLREFPGPLTPPPPWNFQFPPWWGSGYFLELHIWSYKYMKSYMWTAEGRNYMKDDHRSYTCTYNFCSCEKKAWKNKSGLYGIRIPYKSVTYKSIQECFWGFLFATAKVACITAMIFLNINSIAVLITPNNPIF